MLNFCLLTTKRHILARNRVVWRITRKNRFRRLGCSSLEEPPPPKKKQSRVNILMRNFAHTWKETPGGIATKFCMSVDTHDVITCATFCDDRLRGLGVARGRISCFPIDFVTLKTLRLNLTSKLHWDNVLMDTFRYISKLIAKIWCWRSTNE